MAKTLRPNRLIMRNNNRARERPLLIDACASINMRVHDSCSCTNVTTCSSGSSKIKGTASGIYPIPLRISGQYLYLSGSSSTSWGIYISPRKSRSLPGKYIYPPGSQLTSKSYLPLAPPYERRRGWLHRE